MIEVTDIPLPEFLDSLLSHLSNALPSPLYSIVLSFLAHSLAIVTGLYSLLTSIVSTNPLHWDAHTLLPPLISILMAYLAILSLYRTTSWMIRASLWFVKWGIILAALIAGIGWFAGGGNSFWHRGGASGLGGLALDTISGLGNAASGSRARSRSQTRARSSGRNKPKPWESFERHREWQFQENEDRSGNKDVQKIIKEIVDAAETFVMNNGWWKAAMGVVAGQSVDGEGNARRPRRVTTKARTSGSR